MRGRTRFERMILVETALELVAHGWRRSQRVVSQEMMVHEQQRRLEAGLNPQSFEGVAQLPSRLLHGGRTAIRHRGIGGSRQWQETSVRIETERQQKHRDGRGKKRPGTMETCSHGVMLRAVHSSRQGYR